MKIPGLGDRPSTKVNCMEPRLCPNAPMGACLLLTYRYFSTRARKNKNRVEPAGDSSRGAYWGMGGGIVDLIGVPEGCQSRVDGIGGETYITKHCHSACTSCWEMIHLTGNYSIKLDRQAILSW